MRQKTDSKRDAALRVGCFCYQGKIKDGYSSREAEANEEANEKANERGSNKRRYRSHGCDALNLPQLGG